MLLAKIALNIMTLITMTLFRMALSIMTLSIATLDINQNANHKMMLKIMTLIWQMDI